MNENFMKEKPVFPLLVSMALPMVISMLVNSLYNIVDRFFVAQISEDAMTELSLVYPVQNFVNAVAIGVGIGLNAVISYYLGAGDKKAAGCAATQGLALTMLHAVILTIGSLLVIERFLRMFSSSETVIDLGVRYSRIIFLFTIAIMANLYFEKVFQAVGRMKVTMTGMMIGCIVNIILDPLLIFVLDMGVAGAALATILSQLASFCMLLLGCSRGGNLRIRLRNVCIRRDLLVEICKGGVPSLCRQGLASIATICLNRSAGLYGDAAIAAMSVVTRAMQLAQSALIGFGQGFQPVCGFNYGAGLYGRVKDAFRFCVKWATVFLAAASVLGMIFAPQIVAVFRNDPEVIAFGARALRCQCAVFPLCGVIVISSMLTQTINKVWQASLLAAARQGLFFIPAVLILPHVLGELGVQLAQSLSDVCAFALTVPLVLGVLRDMDRQERLERIS